MNHLIAYPLTWDDIELRANNTVGIYKIKNKIAVLSCVSYTAHVDDSKDYMQGFILTNFSTDFTNHGQIRLMDLDDISALDCELNEKDGRFIINTKKYKGYRKSLEKLIEVTDEELKVIGDAPTPLDNIYSDGKVYCFGNIEVYMHSAFIMACREADSGKVIWKTKLGAYLYTDVDEKDGILYFGTDGMGGKFFAVNLSDGSIKYSYNTKGTSNFLYYKDYVLLSNEKNKPVLINRNDGTLYKKLEFDKFEITVYQQMIIDNDKLYAIAAKGNTAYAVCTDL
ncbi:PQQ-binding-like beta-propeller repeat protein [Mogibacterium diversum]|uniref:PQQ-binding-like beta-propeller repeat protein n=2 Tax=Mogibacterium diversum TaxID=114527 RepID=UPI0026ECF939|nr:PQQ-binding-like beta-propeller repeat protein [Mogibacterium diversum]